MIILWLFAWQQRVNYQIDARLDTLNHSIHAIEYITYYNNSPDTLDTIFLHLYANSCGNRYRPFVMGRKEIDKNRVLETGFEDSGCIDILTLVIDGESCEYDINKTLMSVCLHRPLIPGDYTTLRIEFFLKIPGHSVRLGYYKNHYEIVQWYPKPCIYDKKGWHLDTCHTGDAFYGEFGRFDVSISIPANFVVAGTGIRIESEDIEFIDTLIATGKKIIHTDKRTVRFYAENVHDFAWVADPDFSVKRYCVDSIDIYIFYRKKHQKTWNNAGIYAADALKRYNRWYGRYPYKSLSVVDGTFRGAMEYPNLVIIGSAEDRFTRGFEGIIIHKIGRQWFYGMLGAYEMDDAGFGKGFTTYTEIRYFEDKYGKDNSLFKLKFLPVLSHRYIHKLVYYITQTNFLELSDFTTAHKLIDIPVVYENAAYSRPGLFFINLEGLLGRDIFTAVLKKYFDTYKFQHPSAEDFIRICEEVSGRNLAGLINQFLTTDYFCDWRIKGIKKNQVFIENQGKLNIPVDVLVESDKGAKVFSIPPGVGSKTFTLPEGMRIRNVVIDPHHYTLESNYWNNYYPERIIFRPFFALPSFDAYQIIYIPYLWYSAEDGFTPGIYLFGSQFVDFDFIKGKHQWTAGFVYGTRRKKNHSGFSYQTPIIFSRGKRVRILFRGSNSNDEVKLRVGFLTNLGIPFSRSPAISFKNSFSYYGLNSFIAVDSVDWEEGRNIVFENSLSYQYQGWRVNFELNTAAEYWGSDWNYLKSSLEIRKKLSIFPGINVRLFGAKIFGTPPKQEMIYLSGKLKISLLAALLFSQKGYFSPQEHLHIDGDGNMLGYQGDHINALEIVCANVELPSKFPLRLFADFGYYKKSAFDTGLRLVLGPFSFNLPLYTYGVEKWRFNWSIGL